MEPAKLELMQDLSEIVHYEDTGIPLYIRTLKNVKNEKCTL